MGNKKKTNRLRDNYRLVISDEGTFEEKVSFRFTFLKSFVFFGVLSICLIGGTYLLIVNTFLKEYIPGYDSTELRRKSVEYFIKIDSLEKVIFYNDYYTQNVIKALKGEIKPENVGNYTINDSIISDGLDLNLSASKTDSIFRQGLEQDEMYNLFIQENENIKQLLYNPVRGIVVKKFNLSQGRRGISLATNDKENVKAILSGVIIFQTWTIDGYVIIINHDNNYTSVYKNIYTVYKNIGDIIASGEIIGVLQHKNNKTKQFYFELLLNNNPINPLEVIDFDKK